MGCGRGTQRGREAQTSASPHAVHERTSAAISAKQLYLPLRFVDTVHKHSHPASATGGLTVTLRGQ